MKSNRYTIIISPSDLRPAKKLTLHRSTFVLIIFTVLILVCCGIVGSYKFIEHTDLTTQLEQAKQDIGDLREANLVLMRSKHKEQRMREFLGLDRTTDIPGESGGQGGPSATDESVEDFMTSFPEPMIELTLPSKKKKTLSLLDEALILEEDYQELIDYIEEQSHDLAVIPTISPVVVPDAWISSSYGYRKSPFTGAREFHSGLDISAPRGTPILATGDGTVILAGPSGALGKAVRIRHSDDCVTVYGHMLEITVKKHQSVKRGDVIGSMGKTGRATGYHVHYEVRKGKKTVNPYHHLLNWEDRQLFAEEMTDDGEE